MRWIIRLFLAATVIAVAVLGFTPLSVGLTNAVPDIACAPVLAPISNASLVGGSSATEVTVEAWLTDVGYVDDDGKVPADDLAAATARAGELCSDARTGRLGWMGLVAVVGFAAAIGLQTRRTPRVQEVV